MERAGSLTLVWCGGPGRGRDGDDEKGRVDGDGVGSARGVNGLNDSKGCAGHGKTRGFPLRERKVCVPFLLYVESQGMYLALS